MNRKMSTLLSESRKSMVAKWENSAFAGDLVDMNCYFDFFTHSSGLFSTIAINALLLVVMGLQICFSNMEGIPVFIAYSRCMAPILLIGYVATLYSFKTRKCMNQNNVFGIKLWQWGNLLILHRGVTGGLWIYYSTLHREGAGFGSDVVLEFVFTLAVNVMYPVHSPWITVLTLVAETLALCLGAIGTSLSVFFHVFVLCMLVSCVTFVTESRQMDSFKSHCVKEKLLVQLMEKNKEMRTLIGNVAHDLKTPLQAFVSELENISDVNSSSRDSLRGIADFMSMMINRSLDFTKVQSGHCLSPSLETVNILDCVNWATTTITRSGKREKVKISSEIDLTAVHHLIITDKHWLLENLLCFMSNAVKFTTEGSVVVKVTKGSGHKNDKYVLGQDQNQSMTSNELEIQDIKKKGFRTSSSIVPITSGCVEREKVGRAMDNITPKSIQFVRFSVTDTGIGIPNDKRSNLFQPFYQAQRCAGGTGLGLYALSKRIEAIGGQYGVEERSDGAQGCSFWFSIPYRPDTAEGEVTADITMSSRSPGNVPPTAWEGEKIQRKYDLNEHEYTLPTEVCSRTSSHSLRVDDPDLKAHRVLLVDDSNMIQKATTRALQREGFRVSSAYNGMECLQLLREAKESCNPFAVVLMDLQMPVMDGLETVRRIREEEALAALESGQNLEKFLTFPTLCRTQCNNGRQYVIGVSANSDQESVSEVAAAGMDNFIPKPLNVKDLRYLCESQVDF